MPSIGRETDILRRMVTQTGNIAVNNGNATGQSTLPIPIDRNLPYFVINNGSRFGNSAGTSGGFCTVDGMSADDKVDASRSTGATANDAAVYYIVVGVPKA